MAQQNLVLNLKSKYPDTSDTFMKKKLLWSSMFAVKKTLNPGSMREMNDSDSKSFACSDDLMAHVSKTTQLFQKSFFVIWNYTQVFPKKEFVVSLRPNKSPWWKIPFSKGSLHIMCERNVLEVLLQRRWRKNCIEPGKPSGASWFFYHFVPPTGLALAMKCAMFQN